MTVEQDALSEENSIGRCKLCGSLLTEDKDHEYYYLRHFIHTHSVTLMDGVDMLGELIQD